ncbi:MAG: hypothetical protein U0235_27405 [Polyangiaceae bacterium]
MNQFSNGVSNFFLSAFAGRRFGDTQCGLRRYPIDQALALGARADGYAFEAEIVLLWAAAGLPFVEVPAKVTYPPGKERVTGLDLCATPRASSSPSSARSRAPAFSAPDDAGPSPASGHELGDSPPSCPSRRRARALAVLGLGAITHFGIAMACGMRAPADAASVRVPKVDTDGRRSTAGASFVRTTGGIRGPSLGRRGHHRRGARCAVARPHDRKRRRALG